MCNLVYYKLDELVKRVDSEKTSLFLQNINNNSLKIQYFAHMVDWHTEDKDEIFICLDGAANFTIEDKEYHLSKGDILITKAGERHKVSSTGSILLSLEPHKRGRSKKLTK